MSTDPTSPLPPFVDAAFVADHGPRIVLADTRWSLDGSEGRRSHLAASLPAAVYVDLDEVLAGSPSPTAGRHPLPTPAAFAADLGRLGIGIDDPVVAYDQGSGAIAARLVWMLRAIGQPAAVLDGGFAGWTGPTAAGGASRQPVVRAPVPWPDRLLADAHLVDALRDDPDAVVLDARDPDRYAGAHEPVDPRAGHVPGARNLPFSDNLDAGRLRPLEQLRTRYAASGALGRREVVAYCGSGVTACHDLLVLEVLGVEGRLFPGSWSAWSADARRPVATGPDRSC